MAGVLSKTITDDFLTCTICLEIFSDPKSLSCLHSFCLECLQNTAKKTPRARGASTGILQCPLCRTETTIPSSGLEGLKTNFLLLGLGSLLKEQKSFSQKATVCEYCLEDGTEVPAYAKCLDCEEFICERCARVHQRSKATKEHGIVTMDDLKSEKGQNTVRSHCRVLCAAHPKEQVKFFCKSCDKAICVNCRLLDHINHECGQLEDLVTEFKAEIEGLIPGVSTKMDSVQRTLQNVDQLQESADDYSDKVSSEIKDQSAMLHAIINSLEKQLLDKVENGKAQNRKQLQAYKEGLQLTLAAMESTTKYAVNLVKYGNPAEISSMKTQCQERLIHLRDVKVDGLPNLQKLVFKAGAKAGADRNRIIEGFGRLLTEEELETDQPPDSSAPASLIDLTNTEASDEDKRKNRFLVGSLEGKLNACDPEGRHDALCTSNILPVL
ncbi:E3 ubiquitin-protein ligase TRIM56-like [Lingula anatina]|uniref:E3 ubiquitin-protein ligase TRIM56-like n=1 Tax=Lingula anatina TaxID=7574 RepID=A0A1S3HZ97_LINAN|nr:E3 ubiquitin-protein ligase TRIM56-like [Lingula anatina]|eukprot:XP_013390896.1 E3 ubiquitin-protein ligase TRIM56-like [Lingula anatina]